MAISVVMPALELAQETGKVLVWIKKEGEQVAKGEPLLEIETDKVSFELEAQADGILAGVRSREGDVCRWARSSPGWWRRESSRLRNPIPSSRGMAEQARPMTAACAHCGAGSPLRINCRGRAAHIAQSPPDCPRARRRHHEDSRDRSRWADYRRGCRCKAAEAPAPAESLSAIARLMAERTTQSWTTVPHFFLARDIDASALVEAREQLGRDKFTHTDFLIAAGRPRAARSSQDECELDR